jgi:hypothetical protein
MKMKRKSRRVKWVVRAEDEGGVEVVGREVTRPGGDLAAENVTGNERKLNIKKSIYLEIRYWWRARDKRINRNEKEDKEAKVGVDGSRLDELEVVRYV